MFEYRLPSALHPALSIARMAIKCAGGGEFSQFMSHHVLAYKYWDEFFTVVHGYSHSNKFGNNGGTARPGLDHAMISTFLGFVHLSHQTLVNKGALFQ